MEQIAFGALLVMAMASGYVISLLQRLIVAIEGSPTREQYHHASQAILARMATIELAVNNVHKLLSEVPGQDEQQYLPAGLYRAEYSEGSDTGSLVLAAKEQKIPLPSLLK